MPSNHRSRSLALVATAALVLAACGGGDDDDTTSAQIDDQIVIDPDVVAQAREDAENADEVEQARVESEQAADTIADDTATDGEPATDDAGAAPPPTTLAVAEAEEDELDSVLNALTVFNQCLSDEGYEFIGAPGINGGTADQFEQPYVEALGACATSSNILESFDAFGSAQDNRTPEEIAQFNFGLPVFRDCMIARGWTVGELVPDERGALGFGTELSPPAGSDGFGTDDVSDCRLEAEQYVADNFEADT